MTKYANRTTVSPDKSKMEIERVLTRYGANQFMYATKEDMAMIGFMYNGKRIQFKIKLPDRNSSEFKETPSKRRKRSEGNAFIEWERATRQKWRALALGIKAKLELMDSGIVMFEEEFMPFIVLPDGQTFAEKFLPQIKQIYETKKIPALLPGIHL